MFYTQFIASGDFARMQAYFEQLKNKLTNLEDLNREIGSYIINATRNRIYSTKTAPDGTRWPENSELTQRLKGGKSVLYHTGELASDIKITNVDDRGVEITAGAPYASAMQTGVGTVKGKYRSKRESPQIPARPFMGISDANRKRIAQMVRKHISSSMNNESEGDSGITGLGF